MVSLTIPMISAVASLPSDTRRPTLSTSGNIFRANDSDTMSGITSRLVRVS